MLDNNIVVFSLLTRQVAVVIRIYFMFHVYNYIVITDNGSFLVLLDLSAAFDMIDHNLFSILGRYVGIVGSELRLIRSHFSDRTQGVQIESPKRGGEMGFEEARCG